MRTHVGSIEPGFRCPRCKGHHSRLRELFRVSLYKRDCKYRCCSASEAAGLFSWFIKSRYWMKSINSGDTFGPGKFSSSWRKLPTLINFVSNPVSGCRKVVDSRYSATISSSSLVGVGDRWIQRPDQAPDLCNAPGFGKSLDDLVLGTENHRRR